MQEIDTALAVVTGGQARAAAEAKTSARPIEERRIDCPHPDIELGIARAPKHPQPA